MERYFKALNSYAMDLWYEQSNDYNRFDKRYEKHKDKSLVDMDKKLRFALKKYGNDSEINIIEPIMDEVRGFANKTLNMSSSAVEKIFVHDHIKHSEAFIKRAREIEPSLNREGIFQALRNVWVMHSMQMYFGLDVELTDAVFAYSMLYPLTDNLIDDPNISTSDKSEFNLKFSQKIMTGDVAPRNERESKIYHMIDLIEGDWPRNKYQKVYESLMGILLGQDDSLHQQDMKSLFDKDLLSITFYKGGTSVLADAYLVKGRLNETEEKFAYVYGVILQLADDLQDIKSDLKDNHFTMMNIQGTLGHLDIIFNKYMNLIDYFMDNIYAQDHSGQVALKELTYESIQLLIFEALMKSKSYISPKLYKKVCQGSHFSSSTYKKVEKSFNKHLQVILSTL